MDLGSFADFCLQHSLAYAWRHFLWLEWNAKQRASASGNPKVRTCGLRSFGKAVFGPRSQKKLSSAFTHCRPLKTSSVGRLELVQGKPEAAWLGSARGVLKRGKKKRKVFLHTVFPKKPRVAHMFNHGWWRLVAVGGGWWWLVAVGGWRLVVPRAVLNKKKSSSYRTPLGGARWGWSRSQGATFAVMWEPDLDCAVHAGARE